MTITAVDEELLKIKASRAAALQKVKDALAELDITIVSLCEEEMDALDDLQYETLQLRRHSRSRAKQIRESCEAKSL